MLSSRAVALNKVRCTKHIIAHSQTIRSSLLLLFLSVHNKPYTNWELDIMSNAKMLGITVQHRDQQQRFVTRAHD